MIATQPTPMTSSTGVMGACYGAVMDVMEKQCNRCGELQPLANFHVHADGKLGRAGICKTCVKGRYRVEYYRDYRATHREQTLESTARWRRELRDEVLSHYGGRCACCGEARREFLALDHEDGGGNAHRKLLGKSVLSWVRAQGFPAGFRVLCHNCNMARGLYGKCPHESEPKE